MKLLIFLICLIPYGWGFAQDKTTVAVLDLVPKQEAKERVIAQLTELLSTAIGDMGVYGVMPRDSMRAIVRNLSDARLQAEDTASLVQIGRILGVDLLVAGNIALANGNYTITLKMVDVINGEMINAFSDQCPGDDVELFNRLAASFDKFFSVKPLIWSLEYKYGTRKYAGRNQQVKLTILADQPGAAVWIDGTPAASTTPCIQSLQAGEHMVAVRQGNFYGALRVRAVTPELTVKVPMSQDQGNLKIVSVPAGGRVFVDGVEKGVTPMAITEAGDHLVRLVKAGAAPWEKVVVVEKGAARELVVTLPAAGYLTLRGVPDRAVVTLNHRTVENGTLADYPLLSGPTNVRVKAENYETFEQTLDLQAGEHRAIDVNLVHKLSILSIRTAPTGALVYLNDREMGKTPYRNEDLEPGQYQMTVGLDTYDGVAQTIMAEQNKQLDFSFELKHTQAYLLAQKRQKQFVRKVIFGSLSAGFAYLGYYMDSKVADQNLKMDKVDRNYHAARIIGGDYAPYKKEFSELEDKAAGYAALRTVFYALTGCGVAGLGVSFVF
jgi:hypothetical protein